MWHRAFSSAQSFFQCAELSAVHRAFCRTQSFLLCTEPFSCAQSLFLCTELSAVHRAFRCAQSFVLAAFATLVCQRHCVFLCKGTKLKIVMPVSAFAAFATLVCQRNCVFLCKGTKLQNSAQAEFWDCTPVLANETGVFFRGFW